MSVESELVPALSVHATALEAMAGAVNYHHWIFETMRPYLGQRILEVGAGIGTVSDSLRQRERLIILDNDPACVAMLTTRFDAMPTVSVLDADILDSAIPARFAPERLDTVICVNVLEHIADDMCALQQMYEMLAPGGHLIVFVPAHPALYGPIDADLGHERRYVRQDLMAKVGAAGFAVAQCRYFNSLGAAAWFMTGRVSRRRTIRPAQVRLYDTLVVPFLARAERWAAPPFGQSLIAIGRKP